MQVVNKIIKFFNSKNFELDQPLALDDIRNIVYNSPGVMSVIDIQVTVPKTVGTRTYSDVFFDAKASTKNNILFPPKGGIFEVRYPTFDIVGIAV
jgi:hypothetical protein